jgi:hypothetical protein
MSEEKVTTPRLLYRGPADDSAETKEVPDQSALDQALKDGWRLKRIDAQHKAPAPKAATVDIPAQKLQTGTADQVAKDQAAKDHAAADRTAKADAAAKGKK